MPRLTGAPSISDADADRLLDEVLDAGVNLIDTSPDYGRSEELIGQCIAHGRAEFILASKCVGCHPGRARSIRARRSAANIRAGVEQSLRRMRTDHLDIVQFHRQPHTSRWDREGRRVTARSSSRRGQGALHRWCRARCPISTSRSISAHSDVFQIPYSLLAAPEHEDVIEAAAVAEAEQASPSAASVAARPPRLREGRPYFYIFRECPRPRSRCVGTRPPRRPARWHDPHGVHASLHARVTQIIVHDHRRHGQPRHTSMTIWQRHVVVAARRRRSRSEASPQRRIGRGSGLWGPAGTPAARLGIATN